MQDMMIRNAETLVNGRITQALVLSSYSSGMASVYFYKDEDDIEWIMRLNLFITYFRNT